MCVEKCVYGRNQLSPGYGDLTIFSGMGGEIVILRSDSDHFLGMRIGGSHEIPCYSEITTKVVCLEKLFFQAK